MWWVPFFLFTITGTKTTFGMPRTRCNLVLTHSVSGPHLFDELSADDVGGSLGRKHGHTHSDGVDFFFIDLKSHNGRPSPQVVRAVSSSAPPFLKRIGRAASIQATELNGHFAVLDKSGRYLRIYDSQMADLLYTIRADDLGLDNMTEISLRRDLSGGAVLGNDRQLTLFEFDPEKGVTKKLLTSYRGSPVAYFNSDCVVISEKGEILRIDKTGKTISSTPENSIADVDLNQVIVADTHEETGRVLIVDHFRLKVVDLSQGPGRVALLQQIPESIDFAKFDSSGNRIGFIGRVEDKAADDVPVFSMSTVGIVNLAWDLSHIQSALVYHSTLSMSSDGSAFAMLVRGDRGWLVTGSGEHVAGFPNHATGFYRLDEGCSALGHLEIPDLIPASTHLSRVGRQWVFSVQASTPNQHHLLRLGFHPEVVPSGEPIPNKLDLFEKTLRPPSGSSEDGIYLPIPAVDRLAYHYDGKGGTAVQFSTADHFEMPGPKRGSVWNFDRDEETGTWHVHLLGRNRRPIVQYSHLPMYIDPSIGLVPHYDPTGVFVIPAVELSGFVTNMVFRVPSIPVTLDSSPKPD